MTEEERERLINFLLEGQARHEVSIQKTEERFEKSEREYAQLRRVLLAAIRIGRRERTETREKINALINAQMRTEESLMSFRAHTEESRLRVDETISKLATNLAAFQSRTEEMLGALQLQTDLLTKAVSKADQRIDRLEEAGSNGARPS